MKSLTARLKKHTKNTKKSWTKNRPKDWYREIIQNQQINPNTGGCLKPTTRPAKIVWVKNNNNSPDDSSKEEAEEEEAVWFIHKNLTRAFLFCCIFIYMRTHERALSCRDDFNPSRLSDWRACMCVCVSGLRGDASESKKAVAHACVGAWRRHA